MANFSHSAAGVVTNDTTTVLSRWSSFIMNNEKWHSLLQLYTSLIHQIKRMLLFFLQKYWLLFKVYNLSIIH